MTSDPKQKLSSAAIDSNIIYYNSQIRRLVNEIKLLKQQRKFWLDEKKSLTDTDKDHIITKL